MSSFRRPKSEAALRLYNLPRRELQALCKQYGIPANKTNVAMADALSACVPADYGKLKVLAGSSLGVSKTTPMKLKLEKKIGLPETSLAAFILTGKRKISPAKLAEQPAEVEGGFLKPNTTPLKRGVKRSERSGEAVQEEKARVAAVPAVTRAAALQERSGKASAVSSPKPPVPTPRKRAAEAVTVVTRRGGDGHPPVSFYDLVSTPKKFQVRETVELKSTGKSANKMRTRLGQRTGPKEEEGSVPLSHATDVANKFSKGKRVVFADEIELQNNASPESKPQPELESETHQEPETETQPEGETETETVEISCAEIEFKDSAIHKELFGFPMNSPMEEQQDVAPAQKEDLHNEQDALDSTQEAGVAPHQEISEAHEKDETEREEVVQLTPVLQQAGSSASAVVSDTLEIQISNSPISSPAEVLNNSDTIPELDHSVVPSSCEDACEGSDGPVEAREDHTEQHLAQISDPSLLLDNAMSCDDPAENHREKKTEAPANRDTTEIVTEILTKETLTREIPSDSELVLEQEPSSAYVHQVVDEETDSEVTQQLQSEKHDAVDRLGYESLDTQRPEEAQSEDNDVVMLPSGLRDESHDMPCTQETLVSSVLVFDRGQKAQSGSALEFDEAHRSPQGLVVNENTETSPSVAAEESEVTASGEFVISGPGIPNIPVTPAPNAKDNSTMRLSGLGCSNVPVTPAVNVQDDSSKRLSGPRSSDIPVTPATNAQENSAKRSTVPRSFDIPVTPVTKLLNIRDSALASAATPLSKIQSNINLTLAKATSILEKLASYRADAEKKLREGYWDAKFAAVVESSSAATEVDKPVAKTVSAVDRDIPSAKKARPNIKSVLNPEKSLTVCEDTDLTSKSDMPSAKKMRIADESKDLSEVSEKENLSDKSVDSDRSFRKMGGLVRDKKKQGKKFEVLKDRSRNLPDHGNGLATIKESAGLVRPGDMSLRKLRAQVKHKVSQLEASKASPQRSQKAWNTSH